MEPVRINKYLSEAGVCSRREADRLIEKGRVTVNNRLPQIGEKVTDTDLICIDGAPIEKEEERILLLLNKPRGIECTTSHKVRGNVIDYLHYPKRVFPVGRLDKDSEGLLLLTNQGSLVNKLMRAGNRHEKEYVVTVDKPLDKSFLRKLAGGVYLEELDVTTRPCEVQRLDDLTFRIVLTQGYNRQIRRMCETFGYGVRRLKRVRIMNLQLGNLAPGKYRMATEEEWQTLMEALADSSETTVIDNG